MNEDERGITPADVRMLRLPSGHEVRIPDGMTVDEAYWRHGALALSEGLCPHHSTRLEPVPARPGSGVTTGGHCRDCGKYWSLSPGGVAWDVDHDPHSWHPMVPTWVA